MNKQRETIYAIRRSALEGKDQRDYVFGIAEDVARELVDTYCPREQHPDQWNTTQFLAEVNSPIRHRCQSRRRRPRHAEP